MSDDSMVSMQQEDKPVAPQSLSEWVAANKMIILAIIVLALGLAYWYYARGASVAAASSSGMSDMSDVSPMDGVKLNITRMRGGGLY